MGFRQQRERDSFPDVRSNLFWCHLAPLSVPAANASLSFPGPFLTPKLISTESPDNLFCMWKSWPALFLFALSCSLPKSRVAQDLPIFDVHIHYSKSAWSVYPPEVAFAILDRGGVMRALVSSTPDDGTVKLYEHDPHRIVPFLRLYRHQAEMATWTEDTALLLYLEERLKRGIYQGIGEFHLTAGQTNSPVVKRIADLAARYSLFLYVHADEAAVEELIQLRPEVPILWAHAGMSASPARVGQLLDRHPKVWVELSYRFDVAREGQLDPGWRALFQKYPDRFMVGTDTWNNAQWESLPAILADVRSWLKQLPPTIAEKIAFRNASGLFTPP